MINKTPQKLIILTLDKALAINTPHTNGLGFDMLYDIIRLKNGLALVDKSFFEDYQDEAERKLMGFFPPIHPMHKYGWFFLHRKRSEWQPKFKFGKL